MGRELAWFIADIAWVVPMQSSVLSPIWLGRLLLRNVYAWLLYCQLVFKDTAQLVIFYKLCLKIFLVLLVPNVCCNVRVVGVVGVLQPPSTDIGHHDSHCEEPKETDHHQHVDDFQAAASASNCRGGSAICLLQVVLKQLGEENAQGCVIRQHQHLFSSVLCTSFFPRKEKKTRNMPLDKDVILSVCLMVPPSKEAVAAHEESGLEKVPERPAYLLLPSKASEDVSIPCKYLSEKASMIPKVLSLHK